MERPREDPASAGPTLGAPLQRRAPWRALAALAALACYAAAASGQPREGPAADLHELFREDWEWRMEDQPTWASSLGDRRYDARWPEETVAAERRRDRRARRTLAHLRRIDEESLSPADRLNHELFRRGLEDEIAERSFRTFLMPVSQRGGLQTAHELAERLRLSTVTDHENWIERLRGLGPRTDQTIALLRRGLASGLTQPAVLMERVPAQLQHHLVDAPEESPFWAPFADLPSSWSEEDRRAIRASARDALTEVVLPSYRRFHAFFVEEYLPGCRRTTAASDLPRGRELYAFRVRRYTTTDMTAQEIHDLGLAEVARIREAMHDVIREVQFTGTFEEFLTHLRTDPRFHVTDPDELLRRYRAMAKRADPELVQLFGRLPRAPYGVRPIPAEVAPDTTTAYYTRPAADGSRPGTYWVNLHAPETRYLWEIPALTLHEAVPGHHLQIALAQELGELPEFRRHGGYTAFVEGWALYAESLGEVMGMYDDPYSRFGQLTYEMWRAVRLVVDTGLHAFAWSREEAIAYFRSNAPRSEHDIVNEIDRYIAWPGQALAYKVGELKIRQLRARAEAALGDRFDVRAFHDTVLGAGAVPLDVLEGRVDLWIEGHSR